MAKTLSVRRGDRVTLKGGRKVGTEESPGSCDLRGLRVQVVDDPVERLGSVDGRVSERVTVQPVLSTGKLGMPLDVPIERLRDEDRRTNVFAGLGSALRRICGDKYDREREDAQARGVLRATIEFKGGKKIIREEFFDGRVETREE